MSTVWYLMSKIPMAQASVVLANHGIGWHPKGICSCKAKGSTTTVPGFWPTPRSPHPYLILAHVCFLCWNCLILESGCLPSVSSTALRPLDWSGQRRSTNELCLHSNTILFSLFTSVILWSSGILWSLGNPVDSTNFLMTAFSPPAFWVCEKSIYCRYKQRHTATKPRVQLRPHAQQRLGHKEQILHSYSKRPYLSLSLSIRFPPFDSKIACYELYYCAILHIEGAAKCSELFPTIAVEATCTTIWCLICLDIWRSSSEILKQVHQKQSTATRQEICELAFLRR